MRNPSRTAQTAAALTIGVALVTGVTVFAASINETFLGTLDKRVRADLVILVEQPDALQPAAATAALADSPELSRRHRVARRRVQGRRRGHPDPLRRSIPSQLERRSTTPACTMAR